MGGGSGVQGGTEEEAAGPGCGDADGWDRVVLNWSER